MEANNLLPFSPGARIEEVRERYERQNFAVAIDPLDHEQAFRADFKSAPLNASVGLGCGYSSPHVARRSSTMAINAGIDGVHAFHSRFSTPVDRFRRLSSTRATRWLPPWMCRSNACIPPQVPCRLYGCDATPCLHY